MQFNANDALWNGKTRDQEMAEIMGMALAANAGRMFGFPGRPKTPPQESNAALMRKCRGMVREGESPWVTFRHVIRRGEVRLIKRRNKPPLLVPALPARRHF